MKLLNFFPSFGSTGLVAKCITYYDVTKDADYAFSAYLLKQIVKYFRDYGNHKDDYNYTISRGEKTVHLYSDNTGLYIEVIIVSSN